ncbi:uncharacterized protein GGS25DRAFT_521393 [Hypoxylon fragiforme]|uniref:uncharacterized protein n=1 Tax=Hypoxylon fragiforme TaxID=63214 RepID=UPI0020C71028|nr:uncharacterized protein GGS25DRAFT_521393 [Hypoxylon fragiforme]KAI2608218.1 hypothetical protein GGS25DRAFT_521393 [Hypoxylon fragiforme]
MVNVRSYIIGLSLSMLWGTTIGAPVTEPQGNIDAPDTLLEEFELEFDSTLNSQEIEELKKQVKEFYSGKGEVFNGTVDLSLEKRATGAQNDPKPITVNVAAWQNIAEMNCYVILCNYNGNLVWQRNPTAATAATHRSDAGTNLRPFQPGQLGTRGTQQITTDTISAEEFPWASINQGGVGAHLMPATIAEQNAQKSWISAAYSSGYVGWSEWFKLSFSNYDATKIYCPALFGQTPPDTSVCGKKKKSNLYGKSIYPGLYNYIKNAGTLPVTFKQIG